MSAKQDPSVWIKFERGQEDRFSAEYGPFEFIQMTYSTLCAKREDKNEAEEIAYFHDGFWRMCIANSQWETEQEWSDVVIYSK